ncbi:regulatory protein [Lachnospiraceae bacterium XBB1006]|nr:regulatory protein [Lachnospiraceae bacterium XBB1006]
MVVLRAPFLEECMDEQLEREIKEAKKKAMYLLEKQDRTQSQLLAKLREKGFSEEACEEALSYVKSFHYIDDERYARNYIRYRQHTKSRQQLKLDLLKKGIVREDIEAAIAEEYEGNEREMIRKLLLKKHYDPETSDYKEKNRIIAFLMRRGFLMEDIRACMQDDGEWG